MVGRVALGQMFSLSLANRLLHTHHPSSGAVTISQIVTGVPNSLVRINEELLERNIAAPV
jgi:hypothetical protein